MEMKRKHMSEHKSGSLSSRSLILRIKTGLVGLCSFSHQSFVNRATESKSCSHVFDQEEQTVCTELTHTFQCDAAL